MVAVVALLLSMTPIASVQAAPSLSLNPTHGLVGAPITASGSGFSPSGSATLYIDSVAAGNQLTTATVADSGAFSKGFAVPNRSFGQHTVLACKETRAGGPCGEQASATLTIDATAPTAPTTTPTTQAITTTRPPGATTTTPQRATTTQKGATTTTEPGATTTSLPPGVTSTTEALGLANPPTDFPDLDAHDIEITQGVQDFQNRMPLVADRRTWVRVYPHSDNAPEFSWPLVDGAMQLKHGNKTTVIYPENGPISTQKDLDRTNLDHSLNFIIPNEYTAAGNTTFRALVWSFSPSSIDKESNTKNNLREITREFHTGQNPALYIVPLDPTAKAGGNPSAAVMSTLPQWMGDQLLDLQPISAPTFTVDPVTLGPGPEATFKDDNLAPMWDITDAGNKTEPLIRMAWYHGQLGFPNSQRIGGIFSEFLPAGASGWSMSKYFSFWTTNKTGTASHELGHQRGLAHVGCKDTNADGTPDEIEGGGLDASYPYAFPNCRFAALNKKGFYGFTTYHAQPFVYSNDPTSPNAAWPQMSYMEPGWTDPYHYCKLLTAYGVPCAPSDLGLKPKLSAGPGPKPACTPKKTGGFKLDLCVAAGGTEPVLIVPKDPKNYVLVSGSIDFVHGLGTIVQAETANTAAPLKKLPGKRKPPTLTLKRGKNFMSWGPMSITSDVEDSHIYTLSVLDAQGKVLTRVPVDTEATGHGNQQAGDPTKGGFFAQVPVIDGATTIALETPDGKVLANRTASAHTPKVTITSPAAGASVGRDFTIAWTATDEDGDTLTADVQWSNDDGATWHVAALATSATSVAVNDAMTLPGGAVRVRVWVTDGFNTGSAASEAFTVPGARPRMLLTGPPATVPLYAIARFSASVTDPEDGVLKKVNWSSSIDGPLGDDAVIETRALSVGEHVVTAMAKDADGNEVTGTTTFTVVDDGRAAPRVAGAVPDAERRFALATSSTAGDDDDDDSSSVGVVVAAVVAALAAVTTMLVLRRRRGRPQKA